MNGWVNNVNVAGRSCAHVSLFRASMWSLSTTTWHGVMQSGWANLYASWACRWVWYRISETKNVAKTSVFFRFFSLICWEGWIMLCVDFMLGCFFLWFEIYTQCCVWSWIAQINIIKKSIRFLQDFPLRNGMPPDQKKKAYRCDVTYVTNSHSVFGWFSAAHFFLFGTWWKWFSIEYTGVKRTLLIGVMALVGAHLGTFCWKFFLGYSCGLVWEVVSPTLFEMAMHWPKTRRSFPSFFC